MLICEAQKASFLLQIFVLLPPLSKSLVVLDVSVDEFIDSARRQPRGTSSHADVTNYHRFPILKIMSL